MSSNTNSIPSIPGLELGKRFYQNAGRPILAAEYPGLRYSAALIGWGDARRLPGSLRHLIERCGVERVIGSMGRSRGRAGLLTAKSHDRIAGSAGLLRSSKHTGLEMTDQGSCGRLGASCSGGEQSWPSATSAPTGCEGSFSLCKSGGKAGQSYTAGTTVNPMVAKSPSPVKTCVSFNTRITANEVQSV